MKLSDLTVRFHCGTTDMTAFKSSSDVGDFSKVPLVRAALDHKTLEKLESCIIQADDLGDGQVRRDIKDNALVGLEQVIADDRYSVALSTPFVVVNYKDGRSVLHNGAHRVTALLRQEDYTRDVMLVFGAPQGITDFIDTNIKPRSATDIAKSYNSDASTKDVAVITYMASFLQATGRRREITGYQRIKLASDVKLLREIREVSHAADVAAGGVKTRGIPETPINALLVLAKHDSPLKYQRAAEYSQRLRSGHNLVKNCPATVARNEFIRRRDLGAKTDRDHNQRLLTTTFDAFMNGKLLDESTFCTPTKGSPLESLDCAWLSSRIDLI